MQLWVVQIWCWRIKSGRNIILSFTLKVKIVYYLLTVCFYFAFCNIQMYCAVIFSTMSSIYFILINNRIFTKNKLVQGLAKTRGQRKGED